MAWTNVDLSSKMFCEIHLTAILQGVFMNVIHHMCWVTTLTLPNQVTCSCGAIYVFLCLGPANERRRYFLTTSLIGWTRT